MKYTKNAIYLYSNNKLYKMKNYLKDSKVYFH